MVLGWKAVGMHMSDGVNGGTGDLLRLVLVVDPDPEGRERLKGPLRSAGYAVLEAASGLEAQQEVFSGRHHPDLLVTDFQMPGQCGLRLARWFRSRFPGLPVVVVSDRPEDVMAHEQFHPSFVCWHREWETDAFVNLVGQMTGPV